MAKYIPGAMTAQISGSIGSTTFSHNRFGPYMRRRTIPVNPQTAYQLQQRAWLSQLSMAWKSIAEATRLQWTNWASQNPITDTLGMQQILDGHQAYVQLNSRILKAGATIITAPPIGAAPAALTTMTCTYDIGAGTFGVAYTATPLAAGHRLWVMSAVTDSAAINYVANRRKLTSVTAAAQASPFDDQANIEARFGTLIVGQIVHRAVFVFNGLTGLLSAPLIASGTVVTT